jgi:hypothetical protein
MQPTLENSKYPVFEANQVLTNRHLNQVFNYLDEQERLTRANLIGIGIACGLEVTLGGTDGKPVVHIGKGCGITSQGYLIVEPKDVVMAAYRTYTLPDNVPYPLLKGVPLWEMFPEGEPSTTLFNANPTAPDFLNDKVVLLFLELKREKLRNCSPANCDDRGAEVGVTLRRLLIRKSDSRLAWLLDGRGYIEPSDGVKDAKTKALVNNLEEEILARLSLPDIRLPRYNAPASPLSSSNAVYASFLALFRESKLASRTGAALTSAYHAFEPLLRDLYPANPFANFSSLYGFLDYAPKNTVQVRFLQYYYDFFDDLLKAYDEFRWKGAGLMCACCPDEGLFPRHLLLGLVHPELDAGDRICRHYFRASSAISGCEALTEELVLLFRRLVEMTQQFSNDPSLLTLKMPGTSAYYVRITPSKLGDVPLSDKCIPYYYKQSGTPKLFELWNAEKSRRNRAHHNLSYRYFEYNVANLPDFVSDPLHYDLEPTNFLRIEGHINKPFGAVLTQLLTLKAQYRLPIDIIALRTGAFDENMPIDLSREQCRFRDLESLYDTTRDQWLGQLCKELTVLYYVETTAAAPTSSDPGTFKPSKFDFINKYASGFKVDPNKVGGRYEQGLPSSDGRQTFAAKTSTSAQNFDPLFYKLFDAILGLADTLPQDLTGFNYAVFSARYNAFQLAAETLEQARESNDTELDKIQKTSAILAWEEIDDRLEDMVYQCRPDAFKSINDEYIRRIKEVKQKQFLSNFLSKHPGIQHKGGVPLGGTLIIVYHDDPEVSFPGWDKGLLDDRAITDDVTVAVADEIINADAKYSASTGQRRVFSKEVEDAFRSIQLNPTLANDPDIRLVIGAFSGQVISTEANFNVFLDKSANQVISNAVKELADGTVIADFFLPYLCCSDCGGVQYVLPSPRPTFTSTTACTNADNKAEVTIIAHGGAPPYSVKVDSLGYSPLEGVVVLSAGEHTLTLQDADGTESLPQKIVVASKISLDAPAYSCDKDFKNYKARFKVSGGEAPYTSASGSVDANNIFTSKDIPTGTEEEIVITDDKGCSAKVKVNYTCVPPLDVDVSITCTGTDGKAPATIAPKGGNPPYQRMIDGVAINPSIKALKLAAGERTITVSDSNGTVITKKIVVPDPLQAGVATGDYVCSSDFKTYTAKVTVSGGTAPYYVGETALKDNVYTAGPIQSGKTLNITISDKAGCTVTVLLQHNCKVANPVINVGINRTKSTLSSEFTLAPEGGEGPYYYRVNGGEFVLLEGPVKLEPGENTIEVRDKNGVISVPQKIDVPEPVVPLAFGGVDYRCEGGLYRLTFQVSGGRPPYKVVDESIGAIHDNIFESNLIPGGQPVTVEIADSEGEVVSGGFNYECAPPCDKPCAGISRKCSYRLWVQPPPGNFEIYRPGDVTFTFTDEKGKTQTVPGLSIAAMPEMLNKDFHGVMGALIKQMNEKVAKIVGADRLVLTYEQNDEDPFARLWVEYFDCESFNLKFHIAYAQGSSVVKEYEVNYLKAGAANAVLFTNLQEDKEPLRIDAFDCSMRDKCKGTPAEKICKGVAPRITFKAVPDKDTLTLTGMSSGIGPTAIAYWIWEIEKAAEPFYTGAEVVVKVPGLAKGTAVKLTGINKQGCFVTIEKKINPLT